MNPELKELIWIGVLSAIAGLAIAVALLQCWPHIAKRFYLFTLKSNGWLYILGILLFSAFALKSHHDDKPYFAIAFGCFAALEIVALLVFGFKSAPPQQIAAAQSTEPSQMKLTEVFKRFKRQNHTPLK